MKTRAFTMSVRLFVPSMMCAYRADVWREQPGCAARNARYLQFATTRARALTSARYTSQQCYSSEKNTVKMYSSPIKCCEPSSQWI